MNDRMGEVRMLRRVTGIGMLLLAASGCASLRGPIGDAAPGDLATPIASPTPTAPTAQPLSYPEVSGVTTAASPIPTTVPVAPAPIEPVQATPGRKKWGSVANPPPPTVAPPLPVTGPIPGGIGLRPVEPQPEEPVVVALGRIFDKRDSEGVDLLQAYGPMTRDVFQEVLPMVAFLAHKGVEDLNVDDVAGLELPLERLSSLIRSRAALSIPKLCFCDTINDFKIYRPLPEDHVFLAAHGDLPGEYVQLYMEMKNLGSRPDGDQFVTDLACKIDIVDEQGRTQWSWDFPLEKLRLASRSRLIEYYHKFGFYLPASLTPGNYRLNVHLSDRTHPELPRDATSSVPLHIVSAR